MESRFLTAENLCNFKKHLILQEKSKATIEKYLRDAKAFFDFCQQKRNNKRNSYCIQRTFKGKLCRTECKLNACKHKLPI